MVSRTVGAPLPSRPTAPVEEEVGELLGDLFRVLWVRGQAECRALGLTIAQARLLGMLGSPASAEPSELARHLELSRQAVSSAVNHLEREGLVARVHSPTDRRRVLIEFTPAGRRVFRRLRAGHHEMHRRIDRLFSGTEREAAVRILSAIRGDLVGNAELPPYRCPLCRPGSRPMPRGP